MKITGIADIHTFYDDVIIPDTDVLIIAGDVLGAGIIEEWNKFITWISKINVDNIIYVAGNHDRVLEDEKTKEQAKKDLEEAGIIYLEDSSVTIDNIKFYGSPWQIKFCNWAFNLDKHELDEKWRLIPDDTDILITHSPAYGILDTNKKGELNGCFFLRNHIIYKVKPKAHFFGHIHEGYGQAFESDVNFFNVSLCDEHYNLINKPITVEF